MPRSARPEDIKKAVGLRLREAVYAVGSSQREFAGQVNAAENTFSQWCSGVALLDVLVAIRIAERYGVTLEFLYRGRLDTMSEELRRAISDARGNTAGSDAAVYALRGTHRKRTKVNGR